MDRRTRKSKEALKSALLKLLCTKSINEIQIKQLCEAADVNRSTFYNNYSDLQELLSDIYQDIIQNISSQTIDLFLSGDPSPDKLSIVISHALAYLQKNDSYFSLLFSQPAKTRFKEMLYQHYRDSYGLHNLNTPERYHFLYQLIGSFSMIRIWMLEHYPVSIDEMTSIIVDMISLPIDISHNTPCIGKSVSDPYP